MIHSMTGFAARTRDCGPLTLNLELKSVNSRFLDIHFRISDELRRFELPLRELISSRLRRGKVECRLGLSSSGASEHRPVLDSQLLATLQQLEGEVRAVLPQASPLSVAEVLRWPGMLGDTGSELANLGNDVTALATEALDEFCATRTREGDKLKTMMLGCVQEMRSSVATVAPHIPRAQALFAEKLRQRLQEALGGADDERIRQEIVVFAHRIDVAEEISRLNTHLDEVERVLKQGGAVGKRLDFLMQELNREANTLGSKSAVTELSQVSMQLKLLIEQIREQVQNVE